MARVEPFEIKRLPEQGIETNGTVVSYNFFEKQINKPEVDVSLLLLQKGKEEGDDTDGLADIFVTDSNGRFSFVSDVEGKWNMTLSAREKDKAKNYQILLDRLFTPEPRKYRYADMQVNIVERVPARINYDEKETSKDSPKYDFDSFLAAYQDSLARLGISEKVHLIDEITVKGRIRRTKEQEIYQNRSTSVAYYNVASEYDDLYDSGDYSYIVGDNINQMLLRMDYERFSIESEYLSVKKGYELLLEQTIEDFVYLDFHEEVLLYNRQPALIIINYRPVLINAENEFFEYKMMSRRAIKDIYINEKKEIMAQYIISPWPLITPLQLALSYGCVIFIETVNTDWQDAPVAGGKGVRKTFMEGYSVASEFYSPNYSELPPVSNDYRRTLYWNPSVIPDENGSAKVQFYNNSRIGNFSISAETVTPLGVIGVYKNK